MTLSSSFTASNNHPLSSSRYPARSGSFYNSPGPLQTALTHIDLPNSSSAMCPNNLPKTQLQACLSPTQEHSEFPLPTTLIINSSLWHFVVWGVVPDWLQIPFLPYDCSITQPLWGSCYSLNVPRTLSCVLSLLILSHQFWTSFLYHDKL